MQTMRKITLAAVLLALLLSLCACGGDAAVPTTGDSPEKTFTLTVVDGDGAATEFTVTSFADTVGQALLDEGLIAGEDGPYGLYIKTVNGITADYDVDGHYWAFYVGDSYATSGIELTEIEDGGSYALKVE